MTQEAENAAAPPALPRHVSSDGSEIWSWAADLSRWRQREDRIRILRLDISQRTRECGSCRFWMCGRACPREGNKNGRSFGPSMKAPICSKYEMSFTDLKRMAERQAELDALLSARKESTR